MAQGVTRMTPVLLLADADSARMIREAFGDDVAWTVTDDATRGRSLAATGGFVAIFATLPLAGVLPKAVALDPRDESVASVIAATIARPSTTPRADEVSGLAYEEYIELARYAMTRRYLVALLHRHGGSVTDAAQNARMKRESLHRLLRRHHLNADEFRER